MTYDGRVHNIVQVLQLCLVYSNSKELKDKSWLAFLMDLSSSYDFIIECDQEWIALSWLTVVAPEQRMESSR